MEFQETIENEYIDIKEEYEIKIDDNKLKIEINNDEIIFILIVGISYYKYIKKFKYDEIVKELVLYEYNDIEEIYKYLIKSEYKIMDEDKKIIINNKEIKLNEKLLKDNELIKLLIEEVKEIKDKKINEFIRENEEKENKIKRIENKYNELKELVYEIDDNIKDKYKDKINLIYETEVGGKYNIFGEEFVKNNKNNIELNINGDKSGLIKEYNLKKGDNNIRMIIKNRIKNLKKCFIIVKK